MFSHMTLIVQDARKWAGLIILVSTSALHIELHFQLSRRCCDWQSDPLWAWSSKCGVRTWDFIVDI